MAKKFSNANEPLKRFAVKDAEELICDLENVGMSILTNHGYSPNWLKSIGKDMPNIPYHAHKMLSHLWQVRQWMQKKETSAAVRETINAVRQLIYIKNEDMAENFLRGEKIIEAARKGGNTKAQEQNPVTNQRNAQILDYAKKFQGNPRDLAANAAKKFNLTSKTIRQILRKSGRKTK